VLRKDLREQWRTLRLPVVALIFLVVGLGSPLLAKYTPEILKHAGGNIQIAVPTPTTADAVDQFIKNVGQTGPIVAILLAMGLVARERERGTVALILTKPVSRPAFLGSKFTALVATLALSVVVSGLAAFAYTAALFSVLPIDGFVACCALVLLGISVFAAITFLASTAIGKTLPAAGVGFAGYILIAIIGIAPKLQQLTPTGLTDPAKALALGTHPPHLWLSLSANLIWVVACLLASWLSFRRQELG
jgi:ABC-2 type transport system permease protein